MKFLIVKYIYIYRFLINHNSTDIFSRGKSFSGDSGRFIDKNETYEYLDAVENIKWSICRSVTDSESNKYVIKTANCIVLS